MAVEESNAEFWARRRAEADARGLPKARGRSRQARLVLPSEVQSLDVKPDLFADLKAAEVSAAELAKKS